MAAFKLKRKESEAEGIRRVAHERIEEATTLLRDERGDPVEAVHRARKEMKKLRATLKLVRPRLGDKTYRRENRRFRDAGRTLSEVRDAQIRAETVDKLAERFGDDPPPRGWWALRAVIVGESGADDSELEPLRERTAAEIEHGDARIERWPLDSGGFALLRPGLKRSYRRARKCSRDARDDPSDARLHEWRKRSKDLWYQLRLVRRSWPEVIGATADEAHELSDRLGDDHDLVVLAAHLHQAGGPLTAEQREHLDGLIERRREELRQEAFSYGERLFAEKPQRFVKRLEKYWEAKRL